MLKKLLIFTALCFTFSFSTAYARPLQAYAFNCIGKTSATMNIELYTTTKIIHAKQSCNGGGALQPWPELKDADGDVWYTYLEITVLNSLNNQSGYCYISTTEPYVHGDCTGDIQRAPNGIVQYLLSIPDIH